MTHLPELIRDLALILSAACIFAIIFRALKQPLVLGYILAGTLLGPHIPWMPTIIGIQNINVLGELGVIFLLFALGLEFNFEKLWRMSGAASLIAALEVISMCLIGFGIGRLMGWDNLNSFFLGGVLAISSTTIIIKAFEDLGLKTKRFAKTVFAVLIVEDIFAVFILMALSAVSLSHNHSAAAWGVQIAVFLVLIIGWIAGGLWVASPVLRYFKKWMNSEVLLVFSVGLCLCVVLGVTSLGYSAALAAFLCGTFLGETSEREKIKNLIKPIRDLFGAIFFVSVGMTVNPAAIGQYWVLILVVSFATVLGKVISCSLSARLAKKSPGDSVMIGFSLGQIGEFSFIIATLGVTLKVINPVIYPVTVSVAFLTTLTTPILIRMAYRWSKKLEPETPRIS